MSAEFTEGWQQGCVSVFACEANKNIKERPMFYIKYQEWAEGIK